jgi:hypothetical protein
MESNDHSRNNADIIKADTKENVFTELGTAETLDPEQEKKLIRKIDWR